LSTIDPGNEAVSRKVDGLLIKKMRQNKELYKNCRPKKSQFALAGGIMAQLVRCHPKHGDAGAGELAAVGRSAGAEQD
jgi:hypothetical protein